MLFGKKKPKRKRKKLDRIVLQHELEDRKDEIGLIGTRLDVNEVKGKNFRAEITTDFKTIRISYGEDIDLMPDKETEFYCEKMQITEPEQKTAEDLLEHEAGHRENPTDTGLGCPHNIEIHDSILDSVTRALKEKDKKGLENYVANAFEDVLDNINCRNVTDYAGQTLFWNNEGLVNSNKNKFDPFYEAFVKLNLWFSGDVRSYTLLKRFFTNKPEIDEKVKEFTDYMKEQLDLESSVNIHKKYEFDDLFDVDLERREEMWSDMAYQFTSTFIDLLEKPPQQKMFGFGNEDDGESEGNNQGGAEEDNKKSKKEKKKEKKNKESSNQFDEEMKDPQVRQKIAYKRYKAGKGRAEHRDEHEQLYDLYKRMSKDIPVNTSHFTNASSMPLVHYGRRFVEEDERKIRFKGVGIDKNGELGIKTTKRSIEFPISYKVNPSNFPKLKIALMDKSGSMFSGPDGEGPGDESFIPWGDNSRYHYALKGYFGIDNFLENQGIGPYVESCAIGFSGEGSTRGKLEEVARSLLVSPGGGTDLDLEELGKQMEPGALVLSISDGELFGFDDEQKKDLKEKMKQIDYGHIQIGSHTEYSRFLEKLGAPVFIVKGDNDLSKVMVKFVSESYRSKVQEGINK